MANKLSVMANPIRNIISGNRNRLKDNGFNLDLVCEYFLFYFLNIDGGFFVIQQGISKDKDIGGSNP